MKTIHVQYFAVLREQARRGEETLATDARSPADLYEALKECHGLTLPRAVLRVAVNEEFCGWDRPLQEGDRVVFIPPVAGG